LPLTGEDALEDLRGPGGAFAALRALGAGFVRVETRQPHDLIDHIGRIVEHDYPTGAEHRALLDDTFVIQQAALGLFAVQYPDRRAAGDACLECAAGPHATA